MKQQNPDYMDEEVLCLTEGIASEKFLLMSKLQGSIIRKKGSLVGDQCESVKVMCGGLSSPYCLRTSPVITDH